MFYMVTISQQIVLAEIGLTAESTVSSLNFARLIQDAILCNREGLRKAFGQFSLLYEPKNILSGDFYFYYRKGKKKYVAVCDCTGHGISGALSGFPRDWNASHDSACGLFFFDISLIILFVSNCN